jgi:cytochrome c2
MHDSVIVDVSQLQKTFFKIASAKAKQGKPDYKVCSTCHAVAFRRYSALGVRSHVFKVLSFVR